MYSRHGNSFADVQISCAFLLSSRYSAILSPITAFLSTVAPQGLIAAVTVGAIHNHAATSSLIAYHAVSAASSTLFTFYARRHLMVWAIFAPKFLADVILLLACHGWSMLFFVAGAVNNSDQLQWPGQSRHSELDGGTGLAPKKFE